MAARQPARQPMWRDAVEEVGTKLAYLIGFASPSRPPAPAPPLPPAAVTLSVCPSVSVRPRPSAPHPYFRQLLGVVRVTVSQSVSQPLCSLLSPPLICGLQHPMLRPRLSPPFPLSSPLAWGRVFPQASASRSLHIAYIPRCSSFMRFLHLIDGNIGREQASREPLPAAAFHHGAVGTTSATLHPARSLLPPPCPTRPAANDNLQPRSRPLSPSLSLLFPFPSDQQTLFRPLFMSTSVGVCLSARSHSCLSRLQLGLRCAATIMEMAAAAAQAHCTSRQQSSLEGILMGVSVTEAATLAPIAPVSSGPSSKLHRNGIHSLLSRRRCSTQP